MAAVVLLAPPPFDAAAAVGQCVDVASASTMTNVYRILALSPVQQF